MTPTAMAEPICTPKKTEYDDAAELDEVVGDEVVGDQAAVEDGPLGDSAESEENLPPDVTDEFACEIVNDVRVETPRMSTNASIVASELSYWMSDHVREQNSGRTVVETLFQLRQTPKLHRRPDVAFLSFARWPRDQPFPDTDPCPAVPDLAVEVISPTDKVYDIMDRIAEYFAAGVRAVWVVRPRHRQVYVYDSPMAVRVLGGDASLTGEPVLPGFAVGLPRLFASAAPAPVFG